MVIFPFRFLFNQIRKDIAYCRVSDRKEVRQSSVTKNEIFRNMLRQTKNNGIKFSHTIADNWFGSKENMKFVHYELNKQFIFGIKSNRCVSLSMEDMRERRYQSIESLHLRDEESTEVWLKDVPFPVKLLKKVFQHEDGTRGVLYLVTNDLGIDGDEIYGIYQKRWRVEEYHKSLKQNASLAKSPTKVPCSQKNHIFSSIIAYCKLEFLKVRTSLNHFALKCKLILKANQAAFRELQEIRAQS